MSLVLRVLCVLWAASIVLGTGRFTTHIGWKDTRSTLHGHAVIVHARHSVHMKEPTGCSTDLCVICISQPPIIGIPGIANLNVLDACFKTKTSTHTSSTVTVIYIC